MNHYIHTVPLYKSGHDPHHCLLPEDHHSDSAPHPWAPPSHRWSLNYECSPTASGGIPHSRVTALCNLAPHHPETLISYCITTVIFCSCSWSCFDLSQIHYAPLAFIPCPCHLASLGFPPHSLESVESHTINFPLLCPNS